MAHSSGKYKKAINAAADAHLKSHRGELHSESDSGEDADNSVGNGNIKGSGGQETGYESSGKQNDSVYAYTQADNLQAGSGSDDYIVDYGYNEW